MMCAYGFLNSRLVWLWATPAFRVTSSNHRSPSPEAPPAMQATPITSMPATILTFGLRFTGSGLFPGVSLFHQRIRPLRHFYDPVRCYVLEFLCCAGPRPAHNHLIDYRRVV